jgi:hypothetical protein
MYVAAELPVPALGDEDEDEVGAAVASGRGISASFGSSFEGESSRSSEKSQVSVAGGLVGGISWKPALRAAMMVGIPAGLLCSELTPIGPALGLFWMVSAAAWAVSLYVKRARLGRLTMRAGARIGLVTGVLASWLMLVVNGAYIWVERFVLHQGTRMDADWITQVEAGLQGNQLLFAQMGMATAQSAQVAQASRALMMSPEGHAGLVLWEFLAGAAFLTFFAMLGGAMGARFLGNRGRSGI